MVTATVVFPSFALTTEVPNACATATTVPLLGEIDTTAGLLDVHVMFLLFCGPLPLPATSARRSVSLSDTVVSAGAFEFASVSRRRKPLLEENCGSSPGVIVLSSHALGRSVA